jgi:hypothetical protein
VQPNGVIASDGVVDHESTVADVEVGRPCKGVSTDGEFGAADPADQVLGVAGLGLVFQETGRLDGQRDRTGGEVVEEDR